jgi:predicted N-acyltransferase
MADRLAHTTGPRGGELSVRVEARIGSVDRAAWDRLDHGPSPFLRHGFLSALESSRSIGARSGWIPAYILVQDGDRLVGAAAAFVKSHSYAEYIFDFAWASAASRAGVRYYPKLVFAAPMTPATGVRMLLAPELDAARADQVRDALVAAAHAIADDAECSSIHWLFCTQPEQAALARRGFIPRVTFQYHWHNRGYHTFDDFLAALKSRKRKQLRKERERVRAVCAPVAWIAGGDAGEARLDDLDRWYRATTDQHGGMDYLRPGFFHELARALPDQMLIAEVVAAGTRIAGALFFETPAALYGRYWGADQHVELLHFETAYYAAIDRCIARGTPLFEAGAQGEHKLLRGFLPSPTYSAHWLRHAGFSSAIEDFCARERHAVVREMEELATAGPYRREGDAD